MSPRPAIRLSGDSARHRPSPRRGVLPGRARGAGAALAAMVVTAGLVGLGELGSAAYGG